MLKRLEACDAKVARINDLAVHFEQKKFSALLKKPLVSRGTLRAKGDVMLWLTDTPEPTRLRIDGTGLRLLYVNQKSLEIYSLQGKLAAMAASPLPRLVTLREQFDIARDAERPPDDADHGLALVLTPKDAELKKHVDSVRVTLDESTGIVRRFELTDPDGERTEITFTDAKPNGGLTEKDLSLDVPPGTKTTHPLDPASP